MNFYLGTHELAPQWWAAGVPLFVSRRRLIRRKRGLPHATASWALDSGGFTELSLYGEWRTTLGEYVVDVQRYEREIGLLDWVAPQDWMCEPFILRKTGLSVQEHQRLTVRNFLELRQSLGKLVIPVLQGWTLDDYLRCFEMYHLSGVELEWEDTVGLGTVCRRQDEAEASVIVRRLAELFLSTHLHGFGIKLTGLKLFADVLKSADSMAWSYRARNDHPLAGCSHKSCSNCLRYALRWRTELVNDVLGQLRMEVA